jgi:adenylyltransferase/sulfurtransferase
MLADIDVEGQEKLVAAKVLIIGMGGLGSPVAMYLAAAGVGHLVIVDDDVVEVSNLQRQIIHDQHSLGETKVASAQRRVNAINPQVEVTAINTRLSKNELDALVEQVDLVVECTDNFKSRFSTNQSCVELNKPLVSGAAIRMEGQLMTIDPRVAQSPCYQCLYSEVVSDELTCSESGVLAPLVGVIGAMQAIEAIKVICSIGETLVGKLQIFDAKTMQWRTVKLRQDPQCPICAAAE